MTESATTYIKNCLLKRAFLVAFIFLLFSSGMIAQTAPDSSAVPVPKPDSVAATTTSPTPVITTEAPAVTIPDSTGGAVVNTPSAGSTPSTPTITTPDTTVKTPAATTPTVATATPTAKSSFAKKEVVAEFIQKEVELKKGEIVSNVLRVVNASTKPKSFYIDISHPLKWKPLINTNKLFELKPGDTIFVPIRVIPGTEFKGNMSYLINAFLTNEEGKQISSDFFFTSTKKVVKWEMNVVPRERIYFLNNEKTTNFGLYIFNAGNENQDILLTMNEIGRNIVLQDTAGKIITKKFFDLNIAPERDTTMNFKMSYFEGRRNFRMIDNETYLPRSNTEEKKFTLFAKTTESKQSSKNVFTTGKKIDFVRLSNLKKVNPYGTSVVPLIVDANIYNILGNQPIMSLILKGNTLLENGANLIYFTQLNYTGYNYSTEFLRNNSWFVGYYEKRGDIQIGNVASTGAVGLSSSGRGISGHYNIGQKQTIGAFYTRTPTIFGKADRTTFGLSHRFILDTRKQLLSSIGRIINDRAKITTDYVGARIGFDLTSQHQFGAAATLTRNVSTAIPGARIQTFGYLVNANYSGLYFKNRLATNLRATYSTRDFAAVGSTRLILTHRSVYRLTKKWTTILQNNYNQFESPYYENGVRTVINNSIFNNQLYLVSNNSDQKFMPNVFYNISDVFKTVLHYRGVGVDYNYFSLEKNLRFSTSVKGGYNKIVNYPNIKEYFTLQLFTLCQYQNISLNVRYNYGPQSARVVDSTLGFRYPQLFYISLQHQYLFKDTRFMLQTNGNYSYSNLSFNHSFGIYPEMYFFSYDGWRFKLSFGYNVNISNRNKAGLYDPASSLQRTGDESLKPQVTQNFSMGAGIRKEFGIPIPKRFTKVRYANVQFIAFLDANGNRVKDNNEIALENVVVRLNEDEALTNELGAARFLNIRHGNYLLSIIQLEDYKGWFPLKTDSIVVEQTNEKYYIPFVRGIKLAGNIVMDREKYAADANEQLDLSRIRVTVTDSAGKAFSTLTDPKGGYTLYVPSGNYILTMDEAVLGERFGLAQNNIEIELKIGMDGFFYSFYVIEKKRRVNMKKAPVPKSE